MTTSWVIRWKYKMAQVPTKPGIWKLETGGYFIRTKHGMRALPEATLVEAIAVRRSLEKPPEAQNTIPFFNDFAVLLFEERVVRNKIESAATRERWASTLKLYLLPQFHKKRVNEIDTVGLSVEMARWISRGKPSFKDPKKNTTFAPSTANGILRILRTICNVATIRFKLAANPWNGVEFFPEKPTYSPEEPNALSPEKLREFLTVARRDYPQFYAMILLGCVTGLRPSSLRALRKHVDVNWATNQLLVRRSNTRGREIMEKTKTGFAIAVTLPTAVTDVLWDHLQALPKGPMRDSEYLFPSTTGGPRARSVLDKPFEEIAQKIGISHNLTPRAMRRSFQDLARAGEVSGVVTRSISGHRTEAMQEHYSTVYSNEQREALERLYDMVRE